MVLGIEKDMVSCERCCVINKSVMNVPFFFHVPVCGWPWIGKLVLVEINSCWDVRGSGTGEREKNCQIQHVCGQYEIRLEF